MLGCTAQSTKQTTQAPSQETPETSASVSTAANTTVPVTPAVSATGSAMDWYPIAKAEALKWRTDAKLIEASGDNRNGKNYYAIDGKTDKWIYSFISVPILTKYRIIIEAGAITDMDNYDEPLAKMMYDGSPSGDDWVIDSTSAVEIVNTKANGQDFISTISKIRANYLLKFAGMGAATPIAWTISYFPENYGQNFMTYVNGETGDIV